MSSSLQPEAPREMTAPESEVLSFPAALAQETFWFLDQLERNSPALNIPVRFELKGPLDLALLEASFNEIVVRHEVLRTRFERENDELVQIIEPVLRVPIELIDLRSVPEDARQAEAERIGAEEAQRSFDLSRLPLIRVSVVRLEAERHILQVNVHHAVADGWSIGIITDELAAIYAALAKGEPSPLPALPIQFADFTLWHRDHLKGPEIAAQLEYWKRRVAGHIEPDLPTDRPRPPVKKWKGDIVSILLPTELTNRLQQISQQNGATLFMTFLCAFKILLARYTGQEDIAVGSPVVGRNRVEIERLIGVFINTVILRTDLRGNPSFTAALHAVRDTAIEALANQDLPFETLVKELRPNRHAGKLPLFQINFTHQRDFVKPVSFAGIELQAIPSRPFGAMFDLHFFMVERNGVWRASCDYSVDLFEKETALRMLDQFRALLESIAADPSSPIGALSILPSGQETALLAGRHGPAADFPRDGSVPALFAKQARRTPAKIAVRFGAQTLTYRELDEASDRLARRLRSQGAAAGKLVGVCLDRSLEMVVAVLAILKSGAAYVPIDPAYPADRVAAILEDAALPWIVTDRDIALQLPSSRAAMIYPDDDANDSGPVVAEAPIRADDLAYVIFTSGSTGRPKGVQVSHRAVVNFLYAMRHEPGLSADDVVLAVTTLSFDIAGLELYLPLTTGAELVVAPRDAVSDGESLARLIREHGVTLLQATPTTWRLLLAADWAGTPNLKALCGGEALPSDLAGELLPRCAQLWNMYGPTETTIWSTCARITDAHDIHIGRPIAHTELCILDLYGNPAPVGVIGELLIGGEGLARGYLSQPHLTAEKFIPHPNKPGARLYRTGDLARQRSDGNFDCLGRIDHQVKIRGFRVELGDIEAALTTHPKVAQAVVVLREDTPGFKRLTAYFVSRGGESPASSELRAALRRRLPDYMLPAAFVSMAALPLTPNGKIDRKRLPAPEVAGDVAHAIAPRTPREERLLAIFATILGTPVASVRDNFFDLGGHSLLAVKLMAAIEREFGVRLPLARLFDSPTVETLALAIGGDQGTKQWDSLVPLRPQAGRPVLFMVHGAGGNVLLYREVANALGDAVSVYGFQSRGLDRQRPPLLRIADMAAAYLEELLRFQPSGPYHLCGYCMGGAVAYEIARRLRLRGAKVGTITLLDTYNLSVVKRVDGQSRLPFLRQKFGFHLENLSQLGVRDLLGYVGEKIRMAEEAGMAKLSARLQSLRHSVTGAAEHPGSEGIIQELNHAAAWEHVPSAYDGDVTVLRPQKNYDFFPDPNMGWSKLVRGKLDVVELPVNPHAMLTEPCASRVASELRTRILSASPGAAGS